MEGIVLGSVTSLQDHIGGTALGRLPIQQLTDRADGSRAEAAVETATTMRLRK